MGDVIESSISGAFQGWSGETLFKLSNGQYWVQARYAYRYHYAYRPRVRISSVNGRYIMQVEGMSDSVEVKRVSSVVESTIDGEFQGWSGDTTFKLTNGQVWKQASYAYMYHYAYRPEVIIYNPGSGYKLKVDGVSDVLPVKKIN